MMVKYVVEQASRPLPLPNAKLRYLVDAYCGGGLFSLSSHKKFEVSRGGGGSSSSVLS